LTADQIRAHIDAIRDEFAQERSLILPALKFAQTEKGYLTPDDLAAVGEATNLTQAYVESVATFYDRLYLEKKGRWVISVCVTLPCMLRGSDELLHHLCDRLGLDHHGGTTPDGLFTVQEAQCLGACDRAACIQVNAEDMKGPLTNDDADRLLDELRAAPAPTEYAR
jgi:NADH-quinone oxidoreductase subunit E